MGIALAPVLLLLAPGGVAAQTGEGDQSSLPLEVQADSELLARTLLDPGIDPPKAAAAAKHLLRLAQARADALRLVESVLEQAPRAREGARAVLAELSQGWNPPARLFRPVLALSEVPATGPAAANAMGAFRTREAAQALIGLLSPDFPEPTRRGAAESLIRMTGREYGGDAAVWSDWLAGCQSLSETEWRDQLAEGVWRRAERLRQQEAIQLVSLVETQRKLYLALPSGEDRSRLLCQMLGDQRPEIRDLGLDIASREVSAGSLVNESVGDALLSLLATRDASVRARAGTLAAQLSPSGSQQAISEALRKETDQRVAKALLVGIARNPSGAARIPVLAWMAHANSDCAGAAAEAAYALYGIGMLENADAPIIVGALRRVPTSALNPAGCHLIVAFGEATDRERVASLLKSEVPALRLIGAEALAERPEYADAIVEAARVDSALFGSATAAVASSGATAVRFLELAGVGAVAPDVRVVGLARVAAAMRPAALVEAARAEASEPAMVEMLLSMLTTDPIESAGSETAAGLILLAEVRLAAGRPDTALAALALLQPSAGAETVRRANELRTVALIWTNRFEEAAKVGAGASAWLDGLERAIGESHAMHIAEAIQTRFGEHLTAAEASRLAKLRDELKARHPEGTADAGEAPSAAPH